MNHINLPKYKLEMQKEIPEEDWPDCLDEFHTQ